MKKRVLAIWMSVALATCAGCGNAKDDAAQNGDSGVQTVADSEDAGGDGGSSAGTEGTGSDGSTSAGTEGTGSDAGTSEGTEDAGGDGDTSAGTEGTGSDGGTSAGTEDAGGGADTSEGSAGETLLADFEEKAAAGGSAEELANALITNQILPFSGGVVPVSEGLLTGFGNAQITGFSEGAMFSPMISAIPFVGYVFTLKEDTDVDEFISTLEQNADLRWNVCTMAEEMVTGHVDRQVFFVMCNRQLEE